MRPISVIDQRTWDELIRTEYPKVYRLLAHLTRDQHLAEDLTQETFAAAWKKIEGFDGRSSIGTWLHRIAYRKFLDATRWKGLQVERVEAADTTDPLAGLVMSEQQRALYAALDRMEQREREIVVLHYFQKLSYRQMAQVLDEAMGTVKWRTAVALARLRELLSENDEQERNRTTDRAAARAAAAGDSAGT